MALILLVQFLRTDAWSRYQQRPDTGVVRTKGRRARPLKKRQAKKGRWREISGSLLGRESASFLVFAQSVNCRGDEQYNAALNRQQGYFALDCSKVLER